MFPNRYLCTFLILLATMGSGAVHAEDGERPRVGLVLGGGGARGAAHIGVLQELERLRVPVDAIAGTSMGAIVGGLYAAGMSADELEALVNRLDWAAVMSDTPQRRDLSLRRKEDDDQFPIDFELGVREGELVLPKGVVQGQNLLLLLQKLTEPVAHIKDFDDMPIPFRAVASDIEIGAAHVMGAGDFASAIRASMSVPGLIAPVQFDDRLLVDGGLVSNLPIDVIRTMDVDVIIAVDVEFPLYTRDELQSVAAITEQMLTVLTRRETLRQIGTLGANDILIQPKLGIYASSNFAEIGDTVKPGVDAAIEAEARLRELSISEQEYANYTAGRKPDAADSDRLAFVRILHDNRLSAAVLASRLGVSAGDPIDALALGQGANRLYGLDLYEQVNYRIVVENGATGVEYEAVPKSWGSDFLNVGFSVADNFAGETSLNLTARLTKAGLNRRGAEWRTDFQLGTDLALRSELYQPFGDGLNYFFAPRIDLRQSNQNVFVDDMNTARLRVSEAEAGFDFGAELGTSGELRIGTYRGHGDSRIEVGEPAIANADFDTGAVFAGLRFDTFDAPRFPRQGVHAEMRWDLVRPGLGADESYDLLEADILAAWSRGKSSLQAGLYYATTINAAAQAHDYFPLGGFLRMSGLDYRSVSGPHAGMARLVYYRRVSDATGGLFEVPVYLGASAETGNVWQSRAAIGTDNLLVNGSVFVAFDTYFGAIYLAAGFAEGGESSFYLTIGSPLYRRISE